jgi:Spy/CpxP family protein refolding chaperone
VAQPRQPQDGAAQRGPQQLTEQQREQIRAFDEQHRTALETTHRELGDLHRQLNEALTAAQLDNGKINSLRASIVQKETALAQARVDRLSKLSSILTAEQRQNLRGRGIGEIFGRGGAGGGRGGAMVGPQGPGGQGRGMGPMGGRGRGGFMAGPRGGQMGRGQMGRGGQMMPRGGGGRGMIQQRPGARGFAGPGGAADIARLRAEIRRLEIQLQLLQRRRIR